MFWLTLAVFEVGGRCRGRFPSCFCFFGFWVRSALISDFGCFYLFLLKKRGFSIGSWCEKLYLEIGEVFCDFFFQESSDEKRRGFGWWRSLRGDRSRIFGFWSVEISAFFGWWLVKEVVDGGLEIRAIIVFLSWHFWARDVYGLDFCCSFLWNFWDLLLLWNLKIEYLWCSSFQHPRWGGRL